MNGLAYIATAAADLLEQGQWTQGRRARDAGGDPVDPLASEAVAWDICGALIRCGDADRAAIRAVNSCFPHQPLAGWNDSYGRTKDEVVDRLRTAAARIEGGDDAR